MSVFTIQSRIKSEEDVTEQFDLTKFNVCMYHSDTKPTIKLLKWGRGNSEFLAFCPLCSEDKQVFSNLPYKWNKFNPSDGSE